MLGGNVAALGDLGAKNDIKSKRTSMNLEYMQVLQKGLLHQISSKSNLGGRTQTSTPSNLLGLPGDFGGSAFMRTAYIGVRTAGFNPPGGSKAN